MGHFISNHFFRVCNLYWFHLACSATETWNLGNDNYEHLIYYLDNATKTRADQTVQAIIAKNENPGTSAATTRTPFAGRLYFIYQSIWQIISFQMMPPLRSFDDLDGKERGQKKTDDLRAMTTLGPRTLHVVYLIHGYCGGIFSESAKWFRSWNKNKQRHRPMKCHWASCVYRYTN